MAPGPRLCLGQGACPAVVRQLDEAVDQRTAPRFPDRGSAFSRAATPCLWKARPAPWQSRRRRSRIGEETSDELSRCSSPSDGLQFVAHSKVGGRESTGSESGASSDSPSL